MTTHISLKPQSLNGKKGGKCKGHRGFVCVCTCAFHHSSTQSETEALHHTDRSILLSTAGVCVTESNQRDLTSFSTSGMNNFTKLSGKTPFLPLSSPSHQPASAQSYTDTQEPNMSCVTSCDQHRNKMTMLH